MNKKDEEIYRLLVNEIRDYAIVMLDPLGKVLTWNPGAERLQGYKADEIIGAPFSRFFLPEDIKSRKPLRALMTALAKGRWEDEGWHVRKDGSVFWANTVITAVYDENENHRGFAIITRDLTIRREAEIELQKIRAELENRVGKSDRQSGCSESDERRLPCHALTRTPHSVDIGLRMAPITAGRRNG
jgi:two-component system, NtrC family, sensor kinase